SFSERRVRNRNNIGYNRNRTPMSDAEFNQLLQNVRNRFTQSSKFSAAKDAFNNTSYNFSTSQVRQILLLIRLENNRLDLAKLSYARVTDPGSFTQLYDVFSNLSSKNDLNTYI